MIIAHHVILSTYGFWLPNDPRGSWSDFVASWELFLAAGPATTVSIRKSVAERPHDRKARLAAKAALKHAPVRLNGLQARAVASGFAQASHEGQFRLFACAIMPDHVHLVVERKREFIGRIVARLKGRASQRLRTEGLHPFPQTTLRDGSLKSPWAGKYWKVFIDDPAHLDAAVKYVRDNPLKHGFREQHWKCVTPL